MDLGQQNQGPIALESSDIGNETPGSGKEVGNGIGNLN